MGREGVRCVQRGKNDPSCVLGGMAGGGDVTVIIKAAPDEPYYLEWSTQSDAPAWVFESRAEVEAFLSEEVRFRHPVRGDDGHLYIPDEVPEPYRHEVEQQLERADELGSSSYMRRFRWDEEEFIYHGTEVPDPPMNNFWVLPRKHLVQYCMLVLAEKDDELEKLFELRMYD